MKPNKQQSASLITDQRKGNSIKNMMFSPKAEIDSAITDLPAKLREHVMYSHNEQQIRAISVSSSYIQTAVTTSSSN